MNRPGWVMAVGILGIVFGCFGLLGSGQSLLFPTIIKIQKQVFSEMTREMDSQQQEAYPPGSSGAKAPCTRPPKEIFNIIGKMYDAPEWFNTWCIAAGLIGMLVSGFYIFASVWLLLMRRNCIKLFYWGAGVGIGFSILKGVVGVIASPILGLSMMFSSIIWIVITVVLIVVVATSNKDAFRQNKEAFIDV